MAELAFAAAIFAVEFGDSLSFQTSTEEIIKDFAPGGEAVNVLTLLKQFISADEREVNATAGETDDVEGFLFADTCGFKFAGRGCGERFNGVETHFFQFLASGRTHTWKIF